MFWIKIDITDSRLKEKKITRLVGLARRTTKKLEVTQREKDRFNGIYVPKREVTHRVPEERGEKLRH